MSESESESEKINLHGDQMPRTHSPAPHSIQLIDGNRCFFSSATAYDIALVALIILLMGSAF